MKTTTLARLAFKHAYSHAAEEIYLKTEHDYTKPVTFYGLVNERCNVKCRYCEYWRLPTYKDEMTIDEWQKALLSVKEFVGTLFDQLQRRRAVHQAGLPRPDGVLPRSTAFYAG